MTGHPPLPPIPPKPCRSPAARLRLPRADRLAWRCSRQEEGTMKTAARRRSRWSCCRRATRPPTRPNSSMPSARKTTERTRSTGSRSMLSRGVDAAPRLSGGERRDGTNVTASEQIAYANGRVYVLNDGSDTLSVFAVNRSTGALTALPVQPHRARCRTVEVCGRASQRLDGGGRIGERHPRELRRHGDHRHRRARQPVQPRAARGRSPARSAAMGAFVYTGGDGNGHRRIQRGAPPASSRRCRDRRSIRGPPSPRAFATDSTGRLFARN